MAADAYGECIDGGDRHAQAHRRFRDRGRAGRLRLEWLDGGTDRGECTDQHRQPGTGTVAARLDGSVDEQSVCTQGRSGPVHRQNHQQVLPARSRHCDGLRGKAGRVASAHRAHGDQRHQGHHGGAHDRRAGHRYRSTRGAHVGLVRTGQRGQCLVLRRGHKGVHERRRVEHRRFLGGGCRRCAAGNHHAGQAGTGRRVPTGVPADGCGGRGPDQADRRLRRGPGGPLLRRAGDQRSRPARPEQGRGQVLRAGRRAGQAGRAGRTATEKTCGWSPSWRRSDRANRPGDGSPRAVPHLPRGRRRDHRASRRGS